MNELPADEETRDPGIEILESFLKRSWLIPELVFFTDRRSTPEENQGIIHPEPLQTTTQRSRDRDRRQQGKKLQPPNTSLDPFHLWYLDKGLRVEQSDGHKNNP